MGRRSRWRSPGRWAAPFWSAVAPPPPAAAASRRRRTERGPADRPQTDDEGSAAADPSSSVCAETLDELALAQRDVAQRARREQLLDGHAALGETLLVRILEERLQRLAVLLDAVRVPVAPDDRLLFLDHRLQPGERRLRRAGLQQQAETALLRGAERLVQAEGDPGVALDHVAADRHGVHDRVDLRATVVILLQLAVVGEQPAHVRRP